MTIREYLDREKYTPYYSNNKAIMKQLDKFTVEKILQGRPGIFLRCAGPRCAEVDIHLTWCKGKRAYRLSGWR